MYYDKIRYRHSQVLAVTGLTPAEFDALLITFKYHWDRILQRFFPDRECTLTYILRQKGQCVAFDSEQDVFSNSMPSDLRLFSDRLIDGFISFRRFSSAH